MILADGAAQDWIADGKFNPPPDFDEKVQIWPVTTRMNSSKYEEADSIEPVVDLPA